MAGRFRDRRVPVVDRLRGLGAAPLSREQTHEILVLEKS